MRLDDPELVAREYEGVTRLAKRRLDRTAQMTGDLVWSVALEAIAAVHPSRVLDAGSVTAEFAVLISAPEVICVDSSVAAVEAGRSKVLKSRLANIEDLP